MRQSYLKAVEMRVTDSEVCVWKSCSTLTTVNGKLLLQYIREFSCSPAGIREHSRLQKTTLNSDIFQIWKYAVALILVIAFCRLPYVTDWSSAISHFSQPSHFPALGYFFSTSKDTTIHAFPLTLTRVCQQGLLKADPGIPCLPSELARRCIFASVWHQTQANKHCHSAELKIWSTVAWQPLQCDLHVRRSSQIIIL